MPLFRRRNKAGTAEGPVVESNPNIFNFDRPLSALDQAHIESRHESRMREAEKEFAQRMEVRRKATESSQ